MIDYTSWLLSVKPDIGITVERKLHELWVLNGGVFRLEEPYHGLLISEAVAFAHLQGIMDAFGFMENDAIPTVCGKPLPPKCQEVTDRMVTCWRRGEVFCG